MIGMFTRAAGGRVLTGASRPASSARKGVACSHGVSFHGGWLCHAAKVTHPEVGHVAIAHLQCVTFVTLQSCRLQLERPASWQPAASGVSRPSSRSTGSKTSSRCGGRSGCVVVTRSRQATAAGRPIGRIYMQQQRAALAPLPPWGDKAHQPPAGQPSELNPGRRGPQRATPGLLICARESMYIYPSACAIGRPCP